VHLMLSTILLLIHLILKFTGMIGITSIIPLMVTTDLNALLVLKLVVLNTHSSRAIVVMDLVMMIVFLTSMT
jgi:hypothetical protein